MIRATAPKTRSTRRTDIGRTSRFEAWLIQRRHHGLAAARHAVKIQTDSDAFRMMYGAHPGIEGLHALKDSIGVVVRAKAPDRS